MANLNTQDRFSAVKQYILDNPDVSVVDVKCQFGYDSLNEAYLDFRNAHNELRDATNDVYLAEAPVADEKGKGKDVKIDDTEIDKFKPYKLYSQRNLRALSQAKRDDLIIACLEAKSKYMDFFNKNKEAWHSNQKVLQEELEKEKTLLKQQVDETLKSEEHTLDVREAGLDDRKKKLDEREDDLDSRKTKLDAREQQLNDKQKDLGDLEAELDTKKGNLQKKSDEIDNRDIDLKKDEYIIHQIKHPENSQAVMNSHDKDGFLLTAEYNLIDVIREGKEHKIKYWA